MIGSSLLFSPECQGPCESEINATLCPLSVRTREEVTLLGQSHYTQA